MVKAQAGKLDFGANVSNLLKSKGKNLTWLAAETGIGLTTLSEYNRGAIPRVDRALAIASVLDADVEYLFGKQETRRAGKRLVVDAIDADWVEIPELTLLEVDEFGKGEPIATTRMRKDWLYSALGETSGIWIARLFARYDPLDIEYGTALFCKDHKASDRLGEGLYYLFRTNGSVIMAPFTSRESGAAGDAVHHRDIGKEEHQYEPIARVVGQLARPL